MIFSRRLHPLPPLLIPIPRPISCHIQQQKKLTVNERQHSTAKPQSTAASIRAIGDTTVRDQHHCTYTRNERSVLLQALSALHGVWADCCTYLFESGPGWTFLFLAFLIVLVVNESRTIIVLASVLQGSKLGTLHRVWWYHPSTRQCCGSVGTLNSRDPIIISNC